jgi:hypothetical protein
MMVDIDGVNGWLRHATALARCRSAGTTKIGFVSVSSVLSVVNIQGVWHEA